MKNYTIIPLNTEHVEEICLDIKDQYDRGIASCALFSMTLVPEGDPVINKAQILCEKYKLFSSRLKELGVESGVLMQATIGHGYPLNEMFSFTQKINMDDGEPKNCVCPYDKDFQQYLFDAAKTIAECGPKVIMVDDDFRLLGRSNGTAKGCYCHLHKAELTRRLGRELSREELHEYTTKRDAESLEITKIYSDTQRDSLLEAARAIRNGIDSVNPSIQGAFCCCGAGHGVEFADEIANILKGEGNPSIVRLNNGRYCSSSEAPHNISKAVWRTACKTIQLRGNTDIILAETDTCPQNRYSTSAMSLHAHFVNCILSGAAGAKHWITRTMAFEPNSGKAYRNILSKYSKFYEYLSGIAPTLKWFGANLFISPAIVNGFENETGKSMFWLTCVLERMGIPAYCSGEVENAVFLDGRESESFTDEECIKILSGTAVMASESAKVFIERGYGEYVGVDVVKHDGPHASFEILHVTGQKSGSQQRVQRLIPLSDKTVSDSTVYHLKGGKEAIELFPGSTIYKNSLGGTVIVFSGTPEAEFDYKYAFSFLNESRKAQLVKMLRDTGNLPIYFVGDEEVFLRAARMEDNSILCAVYNIGYDRIEGITFDVEEKVSSAELLMPDGNFEAVDFDQNGSILTVKTTAYTIDPVIIRIK